MLEKKLNQSPIAKKETEDERAKKTLKAWETPKKRGFDYLGSSKQGH